MLSERHKHSGGSGDGDKILSKNIVDFDRYKFIAATEFNVTDANAAHAVAASSNLPVVSFTDGVDGLAYCSFMMPPGKKDISQMTLYYYNEVNSAVLYLDFAMDKIRIAEAKVNDSEGVASYTTPGSQPRMEKIVIPKSAYNGIITVGLKPNDVIGVSIKRTASDATDTYGAVWDVLGLLVEFS